MHFGLFNLMTQRDRAQTPSEIYANVVDHVKICLLYTSPSPRD